MSTVKRATCRTSVVVQSASSTLISGTPFTCTVHSSIRFVSGWTPRPSAMSPKRTATEVSGSATTIWRTDSDRPSPPSSSPGSHRRRPSGGLTRSASNAISGTPVSTVAMIRASSSRLRLRKAPSFIRSEGGLLGGRAVIVGVDPHLAEGDQVGPRDRLLAQVHGLAARVAVAELAQALLHVLRGRVRAARSGIQAKAQVRELVLEVRADPALFDHFGISHQGGVSPVLPLKGDCSPGTRAASRRDRRWRCCNRPRGRG